MSKKIISLILSVIIVFSLMMLAGCGDNGSNEVYFLNFKPESADVYREIAKKYEQETGVSVKVVPLPQTLMSKH